MRYLLRQLLCSNSDRLAIAADAAGVVALFVLGYAALHLPLVA